MKHFLSQHALPFNKKVTESGDSLTEWPNVNVSRTFPFSVCARP